jgi:hypothetical protein
MEFRTISELLDNADTALRTFEDPNYTKPTPFALAAAALTDAIPRLSRLVTRANEPDPDKRLYGAEMTRKVLDADLRCISLVERLELMRPRANALEAEEAASVLAAKALEEKVAQEVSAVAAAAKEAIAVAAAATAVALLADETTRAAETAAAALRLRIELETRERARIDARIAAVMNAAAIEAEAARAMISSAAATTSARLMGVRDDREASLISAATIRNGVAATTDSKNFNSGGGVVLSSTKGTVICVTSAQEFDALSIAAQIDSPLIAIFTASWAPLNTALLTALTDIASKEGEHACFVTINVDAVPDVPAAARIRSFPAIGAWVLGQVKVAANGLTNAAKLESVLEEVRQGIKK